MVLLAITAPGVDAVGALALLEIAPPLPAPASLPMKELVCTIRSPVVWIAAPLAAASLATLFSENTE